MRTEGGEVSTKDKLEEIAAAMRTRWLASETTEPSQTNSSMGVDATAEDGSMNDGSTVATPVREAEHESQGTIATQRLSPLAGLDLDTAIRLRWALRDVKAKRTILTPVSPTDLRTLIELKLIDMRDDTPMLTKEGHQVLDH
jgi:hypothetical protein